MREAGAITGDALNTEQLRKIDAYWRGANYLSVGQIYLLDNPDLLVCCVVGDGESETGAMATLWHSNKFLNPPSDGAVLPILHLNGYLYLIHRLCYRRSNHKNLHVRGYKEEGTITPFDMAVLNDLDRFHLVGDVVDRVPKLGYKAAYLKQFLRDRLSSISNTSPDMDKTSLRYVTGNGHTNKQHLLTQR